MHCNVPCTTMRSHRKTGKKLSQPYSTEARCMTHKRYVNDNCCMHVARGSSVVLCLNCNKYIFVHHHTNDSCKAAFALLLSCQRTDCKNVEQDHNPFENIYGLAAARHQPLHRSNDILVSCHILGPCQNTRCTYLSCVAPRWYDRGMPLPNAHSWRQI